MTYTALISLPLAAESYSYWPVVARGSQGLTIRVTAQSEEDRDYLVQYQLDRLASGLYFGVEVARS